MRVRESFPSGWLQGPLLELEDRVKEENKWVKRKMEWLLLLEKPEKAVAGIQQHIHLINPEVMSDLYRRTKGNIRLLRIVTQIADLSEAKILGAASYNHQSKSIMINFPYSTKLLDLFDVFCNNPASMEGLAEVIQTSINSLVNNNERVVVEPETLIFVGLLSYSPMRGGIPRNEESVRACNDFADYLVGEDIDIRLINFLDALNGFPYLSAELPDYINPRTILAFSIDAIGPVKD